MQPNNDNPPPETILVVDDWPQNVQLLCRILHAEGYTLQTATSGLEALESMRVTQPDLILLDIQMPDMDGFEVFQRLKEDADVCGIPVIFISALKDTDYIVQGLRMGAADYVTKPFQIEEVRARVENQLGLVRQRREIERLHNLERRHYEMLIWMKTEFIQMATHDLKNPLGVIHGYMHLLKEHVSVSPEYTRIYTEAMTGIEHSVAKMKTLVTDMLDLAQAQMGISLDLIQTPVAEFLSVALDGFTVLAQQKGVTLNVTLPPNEVQWSVAPKRMTRVVDNLVSNAIKYTPVGGHIDVTVELTAHDIVLQVADTGLGIPEDDLPRLFDAFFRVKTLDHSTIEGTGLGLSVVKTIVEQHQGRITVESELGTGSIFSVILPYQAPVLVVTELPPLAMEADFNLPTD